jgi:serine/threonine protein kinase
MDQQAQQTSNAPAELAKFCPACNKRFAADTSKCPRDGALLAMHIPDPLIGTTIIEKYEIQTPVGSGGWSKVYRARHLGLNKTVAVKTMHAHMASDMGKVLRFQQEAEAVARLDHPNICAMYDYGLLTGNQPYLVMDYLEGSTIADIIRWQGSQPVERCMQIFKQACEGLAEAHRNGIVHRDVKPTNLMLLENADSQLQLKILDFGLAKVAYADGTAMASITATGETIGTPQYMSPEQCTGAALDERSDVYSLGCVMYELLLGCPPVLGSTPYDCMASHIHEIPRPFAEVNAQHAIPSSLEAIVMKTLEKAPEDRFQSMEEMLQALNEVKLDQAPAKYAAKAKRSKSLGAQPIAIISACAAGSALLALVGYMALFHRQEAQNAPSAVQQIQRIDDIDRLVSMADDYATRKGDYGSAEAALEKAYILTEKKFGNPSDQLVRICYQMASTYRQNLKLDRAQSLLEKTATMRQKLHGNSDEQTANFLREAGELDLQMNDYARAETWLSKALATSKIASGENSAAYAGVLQSLSSAEMGLGKSKSALKHAAEAAQTWSKLLPNDSQQVIGAYTQLAEQQQQTGDVAAAKATMADCVASLTNTRTKAAEEALAYKKRLDAFSER